MKQMSIGKTIMGEQKGLISFSFLIISILLLTFLRPLLFFCYPFLFILFCVFFKCKVTKNQVIIVVFTAIVSCLSMLYEGNFIFNYLVSFYLVFTPFLILTLKPPVSEHPVIQEYFQSFMKVFSKVLFVVNISAIIYAIIVLSGSEYPDDIFTGLYGKSGFGSHSLSIINLATSCYYLSTKKFYRFSFFLICGILGFYGLGLLLFLLTLIIINSHYIFSKIRLILKVLVFSVGFVWVVNTVNPGNIDYILVNIRDASKVFSEYSYKEEMEKIHEYKRTFVPRFFTFIDGSIQLIFNDPKIFLFGTSPGTYNSRTAFYLNGDFVQNEFLKEHFSYRTRYHEKYVFPILNRDYLDAQRWNDGTRNQPYSSIISVLFEYGFLVGFLFFHLFFKQIKKIRRSSINLNVSNYFKFLSVFLFLILLVQNYLEYPEIMVFFVVIFKLLDIDSHANKKVDQSKLY